MSIPFSNNSPTGIILNTVLQAGQTAVEQARKEQEKSEGYLAFYKEEFDFAKNHESLLKFQDPDFLEAGKETGVWFSVPDHVRERARYSDNKEALSVLAKIEGLMRFVNRFLARDDLTDSEKMEFLSRFMTSANDRDFTDDDVGTVAQLFAAVMTGDKKSLQVLFLALNHDAMLDIEAKFNQEFGTWAKDQRGIDLRERGNQNARDFLKDMSDAMQKTQKEMGEKTLAEIIEEWDRRIKKTRV